MSGEFEQRQQQQRSFSFLRMLQDSEAAPVKDSASTRSASLEEAAPRRK